MSAAPQERALDVASTRAAFAAGTLRAVRDDAPRVAVDDGVIASERDRADADAMEHERKSRLARWQRIL